MAGTQPVVLKGISYAPVPLKSARDPLSGRPFPDDDFMSSETTALWGPKGRHDLRVLRELGANAVRLYGNDPSLNHSDFMDEAMAQGLHVIAGISNYPYLQMEGNCKTTNLNCYSQVKAAYRKNLENGFVRLQSRTYHPALRTMILINEPDLKFLPPMRPDKFCKPLVSALDAVLDAEREMGIVGAAPNFTVTFSFGVCTHCKDHKRNPGIGQMAALRNAMRKPESVGYKARNDLWAAYQTRFENSVNTANPAKGRDGFEELFLKPYDRYFQGTPVFVGEYHSPEAVDQLKDLEDIMGLAADTSTLLMGISFFEFQVRYDKAGAEMMFGMFGLGDEHFGSVSFNTAQSSTGIDAFASWCLSPMLMPRQAEKCGSMEHGVRYVVSGGWGFGIQGIASAELCCAKCLDSQRCRSWSWQEHGVPKPGESCQGHCYLYGSEPTEKQRLSHGDYVSGLPPPGRFPETGKGQDRPQGTLVADNVLKAFGGPGVDYRRLCPASAVVLLKLTPAQATCKAQWSQQ